MRKSLGVLRVADKILMSIVIAFLAFALDQPVLAKDAGITIQTSRGDYAGTQALTDSITSQLAVTADTDSVNQIRDVLGQLQDGDVLVLAVHSNPGNFGIGPEIEKWGRFWDHFNIQKPPKLAAVIIGGCMSWKDEREGETRYVHINESELDSLRRTLNTQVLFVPPGQLHPALEIHHTNLILRSMLEGRRLSEIGGRWHYVTSPALDRDNITLADLRRIPSLITGLYTSDRNDSCLITNLGRGRYEFKAWRGLGSSPPPDRKPPDRTLWYSIGEGNLGKDGRTIYVEHEGVKGYGGETIRITASHWEIINERTIKQIDFRVYTKGQKPEDPNAGWREGPTWDLVEKK